MLLRRFSLVMLSWLCVLALAGLPRAVPAQSAGSGSPKTAGFVTVGNYGTVWNSPNGAVGSWNDVSTGNQSASLTGIAYGNQRFIATALNGVAWLSADGNKPWRITDLTMKNQPNLTTKQLTCVAYGRGRFVAGGFTAGKGADYVMFFQLRDGETSWTSKVLSGPFTVKSIAYGNDGFMGVGENRSSACAQIFKLQDHTIKPTRLAKVQPLNAVAFGQGSFLAVGQKGQVYRWGSARQKPAAYVLDGVANLFGVTYGGNRFVAVGHGGKVFYSPSGVAKGTWQAVTIPEVFCLYGVAYGAGRYIAVGMDSKFKAAAWWSTDLVNWHKSGREGSMLTAIVYQP